MALRRNPKREDIDKTKETYRGWLNGVSVCAERPEWAGEDYLRGRVKNWLSDFFSRAVYGTDKSLEDCINGQILHYHALKELREEESFWSRLQEETKQLINELIPIVETRIFHIDFRSLNNTKLIFREIFIKSFDLPTKLQINDIRKKFKDDAKRERLWSLVKGMKPTKIINKLDDAIIKVCDYTFDWIEEGSQKKIKKKLLEVEELIKVAKWFIKSREDRLFPWIKQSLESRIEVLNWVTDNYVEDEKNLV